MKRKVIKQVLEWTIIILLFALYAFLVVDAVASSENVIYTIGFCALGLIITVFLSSLVHELGHLIFGLLAGLKIRSITVLFIKFTFKSKRFPKIQFVMPNDFGLTEFLPRTSRGFAKKICISAIGGLVFSTLYLAMGIAFMYVGNYFTYCVFGITFPITAYIILVNLIPFDETSDGYLIFTLMAGGKLKRVIENSLTAIADVMLGVEPKDLDSRLLAEFTSECDVYSVRVIYMRYLAYFRRDRERAVKELISICDSQKLNEEFYMIIFKELFYNAILNSDDAYVKANAEEAINYLSYEMHPIDYRIHASYRLYSGDYDWANLIVKAGEDKITSFEERGICTAELDYLKDIKSQLDKFL